MYIFSSQQQFSDKLAAEKDPDKKAMYERTLAKVSAAFTGLEVAKKDGDKEIQEAASEVWLLTGFTLDLEIKFFKSS